MKHRINANQLRRWMRLHQQGGAPALPRVLPVTLSMSAAPCTEPRVVENPPSVIEIELLGAIVRVPAGTQAQHLRLVLQALRA